MAEIRSRVSDILLGRIRNFSQMDRCRVCLAVGTVRLKPVGSYPRLPHAVLEGAMTRMVACVRSQPKSGKTDEMVKAIAEYIRNYPFSESLHMGIIDLGRGEFTHIGVHNNVDAFVNIMNRDVRISELIREFVEPYEDGEAFHSFSGPEVDLKAYL